MWSRLYNYLKGFFYNDSNVFSPLEFQYMRHQLLIMHSLGSWAEKRYSNGFFAGLKYNLLLIIVSIVVNSLAFVYIWQNRHKTTFFDMGHHILCILLTSWVFQRLILTRTHKYQEMMRDYLFEFHLFYYKDQSQYSAKIFALIH
uniref:Odorant receptors OR5 n=1 Tax=Lobesia botrana TaxID=209534 RepID=A0A345BEU1_9NEOP|nr:odorant receptors OR5 [Lobesia botrana]